MRCRRIIRPIWARVEALLDVRVWVGQLALRRVEHRLLRRLRGWWSLGAGLGDERVESVKKSAVPVCFVDPTPVLGVGEQGLSVDALSAEHGDRGGVGSEAGAVLADVGVGAGTLGRGA